MAVNVCLRAAYYSGFSHGGGSCSRLFPCLLCLPLLGDRKSLGFRLPASYRSDRVWRSAIQKLANDPDKSRPACLERSPESPLSVTKTWLATGTQIQVPIESVPIGARVPTENPNCFEVDPQPEPDQSTWEKLSITVERSDGGIVDAKIIRSRYWMLANGLCTGRFAPLKTPPTECPGNASTGPAALDAPRSRPLTSDIASPVWSLAALDAASGAHRPSMDKLPADIVSVVLDAAKSNGDR